MHALFDSTPTSKVPVATTKNASGGKAYKLSTQAALAKYCATGVFNDTYQASATEQLDRVLELCNESEPEFIAKLAVYTRRHARMKDTPAFLLAYLARHNIELCKRVFPQVINDSKMLRNFVQILRSGVIGTSKSLGSASRNLVRGYLNGLTDEQLFKANIGNKPSLPDIIRMVHPKPANNERAAMYAYLLGKEPKVKMDKDCLLPLAREFEAFKKGDNLEIPNVPFQMLTALPLSTADWSKIAMRATYNQVLKNLNTFARHGVLANEEVVDHLAAKLSNADEVRKTNILPYAIFIAFMNIEVAIPTKIRNALQEAVEVAMENVPAIEGDIYIAMDTSGSMGDPVTGKNGTATTKARYIDVAALFTAAILRKNKNAVVLPFDDGIKQVELNGFDSIMTNAQKLAGLCRGSTDCSVALQHLNQNKAKGSAVIYVSDNESWRAYAKYRGRHAKGTGMMHEWEVFKKRNPGAKLINIDISPSDTTQTADTPDTMMLGGFSDVIFHVIAGFFRGEGNDDFWLNTIKEIKI